MNSHVSIKKYKHNMIYLQLCACILGHYVYIYKNMYSNQLKKGMGIKNLL